MNKYRYIFFSGIQDSCQYKSNYLVRVLFLVFVNFLLICLWQAIIKEHNGQNAGKLIWTLILSRTIGMSLCDVHLRVPGEIQNGSLIVNLCRPCHYIGFHFAFSLGKLCIPAAINFFVALLLGSIFIEDKIIIEGWHISLSLSICIFNAIILDFFLKLSIALLSFWVEEVKGFFLVYHRIMFLFGGAMIPLELFPSWWGKLGRLLPPFIAMNAPAKLFTSFSMDSFCSLLKMQLLYIVFFIIVSEGLFYAGIKKLSINGG